MLPHPDGEAASIAEAFEECRAGLEVLPTDLEEDARAYIDTINETMGKTGIEDPYDRGTNTVKAEQLTPEQKYEFRAAVDELASYLNRRFYGGK
jgi:hypothetical protein